MFEYIGRFVEKILDFAKEGANFVFFHFLHLFVPGIILCIVGIWVKTCLWIGLIILGIDLILSIIEQLRIRKAAITQSDNPVFNEFMDAFCGPGGLNDVRKVLDLKIKSQNLADADNQFSVVSHYDLLIDEGNDPVHDSKALQDDRTGEREPCGVFKCHTDLCGFFCV